MSETAKIIKKCQLVGTPLVAVNTADPAATICAACKVLDDKPPRLQWDFVRGLTSLNESGATWLASAGEYRAESDPVGCLVLCQKLVEHSVVFVHLAQRWLPESAFVQAVWNLRDQFKSNNRMIVFLGKGIVLPAELSDDISLFDEPLPTELELAEIVRQQHKDVDVNAPVELVNRSVEALRGLSAFAAEQVTAMSMQKKGVNIDGLWDRKRQQIEQTPGLRVFRGNDSFDQIGGCDVIKGFLSRIMTGRARPNAIVFVDEIEKMLGGTGDTSGVSQDQLGSLLSYMQDHSAAGMIFVGPPGAAKSAVAKSAGTVGGVPTIQLDLGAAKGSLVGQSERQLRDGLKIITAVSNGSSLWIATCNAIASLPPELRRRFTLGTYFFDLPSDEERKTIWKIWLRHYELLSIQEGAKLPNDHDWTGAEIKQCCDIAWRLDCPPAEAASYVVPIMRSAPDKVNALREQAVGRFLSASYPGVYLRDAGPSQNGKPQASKSRKLQLTE